MNEQEMRANSAKKVQQVLDLMKLLHIRVEAREQIDLQNGFIERKVFWIDEENYPMPEAAAAKVAADPAVPMYTAPETPTTNEELPA